MIDESTRVRTIRALLGMSSRDFAEALGVSSTTLTSWERARAVPNTRGRKALEKMMKRGKLVLLPSGMPVPKENPVDIVKAIH